MGLGGSLGKPACRCSFLSAGYACFCRVSTKTARLGAPSIINQHANNVLDAVPCILRPGQGKGPSC